VRWPVGAGASSASARPAAASLSRVLRRLIALVVVTLGVLAVPLAGASYADEYISSYKITLQVHADGSFHVHEAINYDFSTEVRHGILRTIPVQYRYNDTRDRVVEVTNVAVTSPTGAPTAVDVSEDSGTLTIRIGDPNETVTGPQTYLLDYDVRGAMNVFADHVEVFWNMVGPEWDVPVNAVQAVVEAPATATKAACYAGPEGSGLPCDGYRIVGQQVIFTQAGLPPYEGLTVAVALPKGSVAVPPPILVRRFSLAHAFAVTHWTLAAAFGVLAVGLFGIGYFVWTRGRDRRWVGQVPGLDPPTGTSDGATERRPLFTGPAGAVEFQPPDGIRPGQVGTLVDERADVLDVTATIVDLAVRGYLHIQELPRDHAFSGRDWRLTKVKEPDTALLTYEVTLFDAIFENRKAVLLSDLRRTFAPTLAKIENDLYVDAVTLRWFRRRPDVTRRYWRWLGVGCVVVAGVLTYFLAQFTDAGLVGVGGVLVGAVLVVLAGKMPARTARGSSALARVLGFKQYIHTAEAEQLRFEERADVFSRYLPYAIVFGEADRWAHAFASLASSSSAGTPAGLGWYSGPAGWNFGYFGASMRSFSDTTSSVIAAPSVNVAASGGSGFGGGSVGGGFGGGGGGSW
jgi:uncharacterized membrane protein